MTEIISDSVEKDIIQIIANVTGRSPEEFKPGAKFYDDLGIDSIKAIEIIVALEKQYRIRIRDEQIPKMSVVGQAVDIVKKAMDKKQNEQKK
jgi:acyl carrier protein